ncbi:MAG: peptidoglycan DD-metalloendopeptidase family protein [Myxococcota bacterium]
MTLLCFALSFLLQAADQEHSVLADLERIDRRLTATQEHLNATQLRRDQLKDRLAKLEAELAATQVRQREAYERYRKRVRALARRPAGARGVLLGQMQSMGDYLATTRVLRVIAKYDKGLHAAYVQQTESLRRLEEELSSQRQTVEASLVSLQADRDALAKDRQDRLALLRRLTSEKELQRLAATEKSQARKALAKMVGKLEPKGVLSSRFQSNRGMLPWPVEGPITARFGQQLEQVYGTVTSHNGLDFQVKNGAAVHVVSDGRVAFADWLKGYGQVVIVDHGDHYHSLMAHLRTIDVKVGDTVKRGATVGYAGDTGSLRGNVLYFEIRHRGMPVDPALWLRP